MLRAVTKENCNYYKMNETRNNYSLQKKSSEKIESVLFNHRYLPCNRAHRRTCATSVMLCLQSGLDRGPGQDPCRLV